MAVERKFVNESIKKVKVDRYVQKKLERVGCGKVDVKRTPLGTRIVIYATRPGLVIGRKGKNIQELTEGIKTKFGIENPQIEVQEVEDPSLNPELMAKQLAGTIERGIHFRRASYNLLRQIMSAGALGAQIEVAGKMSGERARNEKFKQGFIKHCGETANQYVKEGYAQAILKAGVVGIRIKITPPMETLFDELSVKAPAIEEGAKEEKAGEKPAEEKLGEKKGEPKAEKEGPAEIKPAAEKPKAKKTEGQPAKAKEKPKAKPAEKKPAKKPAAKKSEKKPAKKTAKPKGEKKVEKGGSSKKK